MMKPNKQHTLLLVIDLQKFLLKLLKKAEPYPPAQILETNEKLITMMTSKGIPSALVSVTQKFLPQKYRQKSSQLALSKDVMAPSLINQALIAFLSCATFLNTTQLIQLLSLAL